MLAGCCLLNRPNADAAKDLPLRASCGTLALTLAGLFAIYIITPYELRWHLRFSLNRLCLQLWPCAIFLFFASFRVQKSRQSLKMSLKMAVL